MKFYNQHSASKKDQLHTESNQHSTSAPQCTEIALPSNSKQKCKKASKKSSPTKPTQRTFNWGAVLAKAIKRTKARQVGQSVCMHGLHCYTL